MPLAYKIYIENAMQKSQYISKTLKTINRNADAIFQRRKSDSFVSVLHMVVKM